MKRVIFVFGVLSFFLVYYLGFVFGGMAIILTILTTKYVYSEIEIFMLNEDYKNRYENIYVIPNHPDSGIELNIPKDLIQYVVRCPHEEIINTVKYEKEMLLRSGNMCYCDPKMIKNEPHLRLMVIPFFFQDGININESWKQFRKRVIFEIREDRSLRHAMLKETDPVWYDKYGNNQNNIVWSK